jgi:hypothetical protein
MARLDVDMKGKALFFKTINVQQKLRRPEFHRISDDLNLAQPPNPKILIGPTTCGNRSREITGPTDALTTAPTKRAGNSK